MALAEQADLIVDLSLRDGVARGLKNAENRLDGLRRSFGRTSDAIRNTQRNLFLLGYFGSGAVGATVKAFGDFEDALATINTVANATPAELDAIGEGMRQLAVDTGVSLTDISAAYYDLVSAGVATKDAQLVLTNATELAIGGLATTSQTVDLLTTALNAYGLKASDVTRVTDGFAAAIAAGKVTAEELSTSFARVAPLAAASGIEIEELQAAFAQLTAAGIPASEASTQMRAAIVALRKPTGDLSKLQDRLGVNFSKVAKNKGLAVAYQQISKAAKELGIDEAELLGNQEALGFLFGVTGKNADRYRENLEKVRNASEGNGVATEQFLKRQQTFNATMGRFRETLRDLGIELGSAIAPAMSRIASKIIELVRENRQPIREFVDDVETLINSVTTEEDIASGLDKALGFLDKIDWNTIGAGLDVTGRAAKLAVDAFNALPAPLQNALITVLAANKLTGGLVSGVLGDVAGIALRSLTTIRAANVTVIGSNVVAPGGRGGGVVVPGRTDKGERDGVTGPRTPAPVPGKRGPVLTPGRAGLITGGAIIAGEVAGTLAPPWLQGAIDTAVNVGTAAAVGTAVGGPLGGLAGIALTLQSTVEDVASTIFGPLVRSPFGDSSRFTGGAGEGETQGALDTIAEGSVKSALLLDDQRETFYKIAGELTASGQTTSEQFDAILNIGRKLDAGKITAEEANRRLEKIDAAVKGQDLNVAVTVATTTQVNVADVGEKLVIARGLNRYVIE